MWYCISPTSLVVFCWCFWNCTWIVHSATGKFCTPSKLPFFFVFFSSVSYVFIMHCCNGWYDKIQFHLPGSLCETHPAPFYMQWYTAQYLTSSCRVTVSYLNSCCHSCFYTIPGSLFEFQNFMDHNFNLYNIFHIFFGSRHGRFYFCVIIN